jgi:Protein of unknown function (DUF3253)
VPTTPQRAMPGTSQARHDLKCCLDKLLASREPPKTICPSEVARALSREKLNPAGRLSWRELMPEIRNLVAETRGRGEVVVLQKGTVLSGELGEGLVDVKGPIRVRRVA